MKYILLTLTLLALLFSTPSCSKDQRKVNKVEGSWKLVTVDGTDLADDQKIRFVFNQCLLRNNDYCDVLISSQDTTINTGYKVSNKGETMIFDEYVIPFAFTNNYDIIELEDEQMVLENSAAGTTRRLEFIRE